MPHLPSSSHALSRTFSRREALRFFGVAGASAVLASSSLRAASAEATAPAPAPAGNAQTGFYRFKIGATEAVALIDGGFGGPASQIKLWKGATDEQIAAELGAAFLGDQIRLPFSVLLVRLGAEWVLIDAGAGALFGPAGGKLRANLAAAGFSPEQISAVVLTHAHGDHMGGLLDPQTQAPVFKNARHFVSRREYEFWTGSSPDVSQVNVPDADKKRAVADAQTYLKAIKFEQIAPGEKLLEGLELLDASGHTPGHLALLISSGNEQLLHLVDAVHHHVLSFTQPDASFAYDADPQQAIVTRKRLLDRAAADRLRVFGAHLPFPSLGHVRAVAKNRYELVPEPWVSA